MNIYSIYLCFPLELFTLLYFALLCSQLNIIFLLLIIAVVMLLQTVVSFSPSADFVGGPLCNAEKELGAL